MSEKSLSKIAGPIGLIAAGVVAGGVLTASLSASADNTSTPAPTASGAAAHPHETLLTGDALAKVRAAVLDKYPGATIERVETDADGVYEAHLVTAAGVHLTAEVNKNYKVTGVEKHGPCLHGGHPGGRSGRHHDGPPPPTNG